MNREHRLDVHASSRFGRLGLRRCVAAWVLTTNSVGENSLTTLSAAPASKVLAMILFLPKADDVHLNERACWRNVPSPSGATSSAATRC